MQVEVPVTHVASALVGLRQMTASAGTHAEKRGARSGDGRDALCRVFARVMFCMPWEDHSRAAKLICMCAVCVANL